MFGLLNEAGVGDEYKWRLEDVKISWERVLGLDKGEAARESRCSLVLLIGGSGKIAWDKEDLGSTGAEASIRLSFLNIEDGEDNPAERTISWVRRGMSARIRKRIRATGKAADLCPLYAMRWGFRSVALEALVGEFRGTLTSGCLEKGKPHEIREEAAGT